MDTVKDVKYAKVAELASKGGVMKLKDMLSCENLANTKNNSDLAVQPMDGK